MMKDLFVLKVFAYIEKFHMIGEGDRVLVGVSGGVDSLCLLRLLGMYREKTGFSLECVHVEHGIRGEESLEDMAFVQGVCSEMGIVCRVVRADAPGRAALEGRSLEEAARMIRYEAFREALGDSRGKIALAHHQDDQAETMLLNLARGSGLRGLAGMLPVTCRPEEVVLRPLLCCSRTEIEEWMRSRGESWRVDSTNRSDEHTRNRIRHHIIPALKEQVNERASAHMAAAARRIGDADACLRELAVKALKEGILEEEIPEEGSPGVVTLRLKPLSVLPEILREYALMEAVRLCCGESGLRDFGEVHVEALKALAGKSGSAHLDLPGQLQADAQAGRLRLCGKEAAGPRNTAGGGGTDKERGLMSGSRTGYLSTEECENPEQIVISEEALRNGPVSCRFGDMLFTARIVREEEVPPPDELRKEKKYTKWLAYDTMKDSLCLRHRRSGDYLVINREGGRRKLKNFLIDRKIPAADRDKVVLLAQGSHILWVVGERISEAAKVAAGQCREELPRKEISVRNGEEILRKAATEQDKEEKRQIVLKIVWRTPDDDRTDPDTDFTGRD